MAAAAIGALLVWGLPAYPATSAAAFRVDAPCFGCMPGDAAHGGPGVFGVVSASDGEAAAASAPAVYGRWDSASAAERPSLAVALVTVPLPASLPLLLAGVAGIAVIGWRRRMKARRTLESG